MCVIEGICSTGTTMFDHWGEPTRIAVHEYQDRIEMIYKQTSTVVYTVYPAPPPEERVFKIVFSCKNGKWHKSERIFGEIMPAQEEFYTFDDE